MRVFISEGPCNDFVWVDGVAVQRWEGTLVCEGGVVFQGSLYVYRFEPSSKTPATPEGTSAVPSE